MKIIRYRDSQGNLHFGRQIGKTLSNPVVLEPR